MAIIKIKRAYESPSRSDGFRILIDRMWPRGIKKENAHIDLWLKEVAPSTALRQWFKHDPKKWPEFQKRYFVELVKEKDRLKIIKDKTRKHTVTLVYAAKDEEHNNAVVLLKFILKHKS